MGWHLGLERMRELCARLDEPQRRLRVIHVVGTNGKSSVAELCRWLLDAAGIRAGAYMSPHMGSWSERVRLPSGDEAASFAAAVERAAAEAAAIVAEQGEAAMPTQFELATAAALLALAEAGCEVAAVEAGMGGRLDATNVCEGEVVVLTSVGLEHTRWLGETVEEIAAEKLAVLDPGAKLVIGDVPDSVLVLARERAAAAGADLIVASERHPPAAPGFGPANRAIALSAVEALGISAPALPAGPPLPARGELLAGDPDVLLDLAHNPAAARALAVAPELGGRRVIGCFALLDDKDAAGFAAALAPVLEAVVATETGPLPGSARPGAASFPVERLAEEFRRAGVAEVSAVADPRRAVELALTRARELGGIALISGSHYLLRHEWIPGRDRSCSR